MNRLKKGHFKHLSKQLTNNYCDFANTPYDRDPFLDAEQWSTHLQDILFCTKVSGITHRKHHQTPFSCPFTLEICIRALIHQCEPTSTHMGPLVLPPAMGDVESSYATRMNSATQVHYLLNLYRPSTERCSPLSGKLSKLSASKPTSRLMLSS